MTRFEIRDQLRQYIADGKLLTKANLRAEQGMAYATINRAVANREYFVTYYEEIVATDSDARLWLNNLIDEKRIMTFLQVQNYKGYVTKYEVEKACQEGILMRFYDFGKAIPLYID